MHPVLTRRSSARLIFIIGLLLMFLGVAFLLGSIAGSSQISVLVSFLFVILGSLFAVFAISLKKRSLYLFFAAFFLLVGLFLFLSALKIIPISFTQDWPLISVFSGLALIPAGWHRFGAFRSSYAVPAIAFIVLGSALMIFSLNLVSFSFKQFVLDWWPLLVVLAGLILVLVSLGTKYNAGEIKR
jgi:O-antigen ligase